MTTSSNTGVLAKSFDRVHQIRMGSVVGCEANGGFLLGFEADGPADKFEPLMTRDCVLPLFIGLIPAKWWPISERIVEEPAGLAVADRLQEVPQAFSGELVERLAESDDELQYFWVYSGEKRRRSISLMGCVQHCQIAVRCICACRVEQPHWIPIKILK